VRETERVGTSRELKFWPFWPRENGSSETVSCGERENSTEKEEDGRGRDEEIQFEVPIQPANTEVILL
jgi:hypothetical protein